MKIKRVVLSVALAVGASGSVDCMQVQVCDPAALIESQTSDVSLPVDSGEDISDFHSTETYSSNCADLIETQTSDIHTPVDSGEDISDLRPTETYSSNYVDLVEAQTSDVQTPVDPEEPNENLPAERPIRNVETCCCPGDTCFWFYVGSCYGVFFFALFMGYMISFMKSG
jgi:hypothetical protein